MQGWRIQGRAGARRGTGARWWRRLAAMAGVVAASLGVAAPPVAAPTHEVYVWQRVWNEPLRGALGDSRDLFSGVRVLVAQVSGDGRWQATQADPAAFTGDARRRVAVVRFDGAGQAPVAESLLAELRPLLARWQSGAAPFAAVEIDYDCGTARLADYAERLRTLRGGLPAGLALSVTALPAWLDAGEIDGVLDAVDESVLQVHAVQRPTAGLFDAASAERWARAFARRTTRPFRLALPAYGTRVYFDDAGQPRAVESEARLEDRPALPGEELAAEPREVLSLLARLRADPPAHWQGVAWFRLPLPGDRRAWTLAALREVIAGTLPRARFEVRLTPQANGAHDLALANGGTVAAPAPALRVATACNAHDAVGDWIAAGDATRLRFLPKPGFRLPPGRTSPVGWLRCAQAPVVTIEDSQAKDVQ